MSKLRESSWARRGGVVALAAAAMVAIASTPSYAAVSLSTTGAAGRAVYAGDNIHRLYAKDPLTDGHCAQWQIRLPGGQWQWSGDRACSSSEEYVSATASGNQIRICRTGVGNCSAAYQLRPGA
ncbi:hypothetical protein V1634_25480 [Plantactinospora veratri]|uniref:Uncharacterized protein n=1 Tax=Plantactinospora veratri TaxID=1436122 RepID=A0ABU7SJP2_9ACTN